MEKIQQILKNTTPAGKFMIEVAGQEAVEMEIFSRFVYLELGNVIRKGVIFLPHFAAAEQIGNTNNGCIYFNSLNSELSSFSISSSNKQNIEIILHLASMAQLSFKEFLKLTSSTKFEIKEHMIAKFPDEQFPKPVQIYLQNLTLTVYENNQQKIEYHINNRTNFHFPPIKMQPMFGISNSPTDLVWFSVPSYEKVEEWFLIFSSIQNDLNKQKESLLRNISVEKFNVEKNTDKNEENNEKNNINQPESPNRSQEGLETRTVTNTNEKRLKRNSNATASVDNLTELFFLANQKRNKRISELKAQSEQMKTQLKTKLSKYQPKKYISEVPIPELDAHQSTIAETPDVNSLLQSEKIFEDKTSSIKSEIMQSIVSPNINAIRYLKGTCSYIPLSFNLNYNPWSPESFVTLFTNSNPNNAFVLTMAIIKNGFTGNSISRIYEVPKKINDTPSDELANIIEVHKNDIFDYILEQSNRLNEFYSPTAMARDYSLIKYLKSLNKELIRPNNLPDHIPFNFDHNPVEAIKHWIYNVLYDSKMGNHDTRKYVFQLSRVLASFFNQYMIAGNLDSFFRSIAAESSNSHMWKEFKNQPDWNMAWLFHWLHAYKENNLINCFCEIFNLHQATIRRCYAPCSCVLNVDAVNTALWCMAIFVDLNLPADYELEKSSVSILSFFSKMM